VRRERASVATGEGTVPSSQPSPATPVGRRGDAVVRQALNYKGTRYKYGGTTKKGLDCSGLVARVWADLKMKKIPRASSALYNSGKPVHLAELQPGDLVFFKNTYKRGISHVGVYAGNNKFVHASGHRTGVTITKLSEPYYQLHYAGARRLY
jgi:cell wall-associated NlpC family hydrolase